MILRKVIHNERPGFKITSKNVLITSYLICGVALLLHYIFNYSLAGFIGLGAVLFIPISIITIIWGWNEYYPKTTVPLGSIQLSLSTIKIDEQTYDFDDLNNLVFDVNDFRGERMTYPYGVPAGPCLSQGDSNFIRFKHKGIDIQVQFLLRSKEELIILGEYLTELYLNNVAFNETVNGGKSYGLEHLNYNDIQEYKKKHLTSDAHKQGYPH